MSNLLNISEDDIIKIRYMIKMDKIHAENSALIARVIGSPEENVLTIIQKNEETNIKDLIDMIKNAYWDSLSAQMLALDQEIEDWKRIIKEKIHKHDQIEHELYNLWLT